MSGEQTTPEQSDIPRTPLVTVTVESVWGLLEAGDALRDLIAEPLATEDEITEAVASWKRHAGLMRGPVGYRS